MDSKIVHFTRRERFSAAHKLWNNKWDHDTNHEMYGKCAHENWHGHNYILFVTVKGIADSDSGMVMDLRDLKKIMKEKVVDKCDHKNLNLDVDFLNDKITTAENLAMAMWGEMEEEIKKYNVELHCVRIIETENNSAEYYG